MQLSAAAQWLNTAFAGFDMSVTAAVHRLYEAAGPVLTPFMKLVSLMGKDGIFLILLSIALMLFKPTRRFGTAMLLGVSIGAIFTNLFIKVVVARPRPYADPNGFYYPLWEMLGRATESDKSFPSGHTTAAAASMVPVFLIGKKRVSWTALLFPLLMGLSRIYLVVHYPSDVLGGLIVGTVAGCIAALLAQRAVPRKYYDKDLFGRGYKGKHECSSEK